ncbi:aldo/keto reductase family protein [Hirsutella rhossiliensis]|uniref:Aldo/keto reductase family domain-containing protein n=1 Tax=Hirsutella rhossiliensis TaxID=111463 RepID=A0A9P8NAQ7_9HYPO|nr:aldo/keto reductase family domain-containing protein [Hirsutella rhossiliensis]KAH0968819.1 aldo/keto reductase family domain-containing protein [Hirsutella rhossiliensis]
MPSKLPVRRVGRLGPYVPIVGFGAMGMSIGYGSTGTDEDKLKLLDRAWELGCTNWDTADVYGDSEDTIGKWFQLHPGRREDIFLATKFGLRACSDGIHADSSPDFCREAIEQSLARLGVTQIDLYYVHRADPAVPIEKTVAAMKQMVEQGKIKYIGLSEVSSDCLRRAHAVHPISAVQMEYNPWTRDIEGPSGTNLMDTCKELGVAMFAYSPLGRGILTGRYRSASDLEPDDSRRMLQRFEEGNLGENAQLVDKLAEIADRKGCTSAQLVLAWLTRQNEHIFVIPGTRSVNYLEENVAASHLHVTDEEQREVRQLVESIEVKGGRDPMFGHFVTTVSLEQSLCG